MFSGMIIFVCRKQKQKKPELKATFHPTQTESPPPCRGLKSSHPKAHTHQMWKSTQYITQTNNYFRHCGPRADVVDKSTCQKMPRNEVDFKSPLSVCPTLLPHMPLLTWLHLCISKVFKPSISNNCPKIERQQPSQKNTATTSPPMHSLPHQTESMHNQSL